MFAGDLQFAGSHLCLADGDPSRLVEVLLDLMLINAARFIPGHGPVGTVDDVRMLIDDVELCMETALVLAGNRSPAEEDAAEPECPERFSHWRQRRFYEANIRFLRAELISTCGR